MEKYWDISLFVIAVFAILTAVAAITCARRSHKDNDEIFGFFATIFGLVALFLCGATIYASHQIASEYGKEYTMVVDVYVGQGEPQRKTFKTINKSINIEYPWRGNMSTEIKSRGDILYRTTGDIEVVSYTYKTINQE